jgi:hypothetical protein
MKSMKHKDAVDVNAPVLSQPQFCLAAGVDMATANNWVARKILEPTEIGGRQIKGTRLYSIGKTFEGRVIGELVQQRLGPVVALEGLLKAANVAKLATKGGWVEHWARALEQNRPSVTGFIILVWSKDSYDGQWVNAEDSGWPDFSSVPNLRRRFLDHPFTVLPVTTLFKDVWHKCMTMLAADPKA